MRAVHFGFAETGAQEFVAQHILVCCFRFLLRVGLEEIQENVENGIAHYSTLRLTL